MGWHILSMPLGKFFSTLCISHDPGTTPPPMLHPHYATVMLQSSKEIGGYKECTPALPTILSPYYSTVSLPNQLTVCMHTQHPQTISRPHPSQVKHLHITWPVNAPCFPYLCLWTPAAAMSGFPHYLPAIIPLLSHEAIVDTPVLCEQMVFHYERSW